MNQFIPITAAMLLLVLPQSASPQAHQPYAGLDARPIKALSEQQLADLKAGRGMGLALAAELNGYPGPVHVLELAEPLGLTPSQQARVTRLLDAMKQEAVALGERLIEAEADLDRQLAGKTVTEASLTDGVYGVAALQGALRAAHLRYHLATLELLTPDQTARYAALRGYGGAQPAPGHHQGR